MVVTIALVEHQDADKDERGKHSRAGGLSRNSRCRNAGAMAALRVGAGRLAVGAPAAIAPSLAALMPEARVIALRSETGGGISAVGLNALRSTAARADAICADRA